MATTTNPVSNFVTANGVFEIIGTTVKTSQRTTLEDVRGVRGGVAVRNLNKYMPRQLKDEHAVVFLQTANMVVSVISPQEDDNAKDRKIDIDTGIAIADSDLEGFYHLFGRYYHIKTRTPAWVATGSARTDNSSQYGSPMGLPTSAQGKTVVGLINGFLCLM